MATIKLVANDTRPVLQFNITSEGKAVDLTGATVKFYMKNRDTGAVKINGEECLVTNAEKGLCQYSFTASDTDTPGEYQSEVEVTFADSSIQTGFKQDTIIIRSDI